jgi:hypothetical protein
MLQNADEITKKILNSGKVQLLMFADIKAYKGQSTLRKFRFFGKAPDQFIDVTVSNLYADILSLYTTVLYKDKIEVDTTSPAIKEFASLRGALNKVRKCEPGVYPSLVVAILEKEDGR